MEEIVEGTTRFLADRAAQVSKGMEVFYNPVMRLNRDLSLLVLASRNWRRLRIALPMAASGVRAARILNELVPDSLEPECLHVNDVDARAAECIEKNLERNIGSYPRERVTVQQKDAVAFLRSSGFFDYIEIDPFGSPVGFLDAAVRRLAHEGVLSMTATDTSALSGTYPSVTLRRYWAVPSRTWVMHEIGLRILIRKAQLIAAQYDRALSPILSVATDHYYKVFLECKESKRAASDIVRQHETVSVDRATLSVRSGGEVGPLWTGPLHEAALVGRMREIANALGYEDAHKLLGIVGDECRVHAMGFVHLDLLAKLLRIDPPARDEVLEKLAQHGARTHIDPKGIKTDLPFERIRDLL